MHTPLMNFRMMNHKFTKRDLCIGCTILVIAILVSGGIMGIVYGIDHKNKLSAVPNSNIFLIIFGCAYLAIMCFVVGYLVYWCMKEDEEEYDMNSS
jgi:hypothetical protein